MNRESSRKIRGVPGGAASVINSDQVGTPDYVPVDLTSATNFAGPVPGAPAPAGDLTFHGIPFRVCANGSTDSPRFILLGANVPPVTVPIDADAYFIIVAHRLHDESEDALMGTGALRAVYQVSYSDDVTVECPIRRRFEVDSAPAQGWDFDVPFAATLSSSPCLPSKHSGAWDQLGTRRSEASLTLPSSYLLWAWENPRPGKRVRSITLRGVHGRVLVAAITVSRVDEQPFTRSAAVPVTIERADESVGMHPHLCIDRGTVGYTEPLVPPAPSDAVAGFGYPAAPSVGVVAYVAGIPSATITLADGVDPVASINWGELATRQRVELERFRVTVRDEGRTWCRISVVDDDDGQPIPCRIHLRSAAGVAYPPYGHRPRVTRGLDHFGDVQLGAITYAYIDGECEGWLPRGSVLVEIARGFEYEPLRTTIQVCADTDRIEFRLRRWSHMNSKGWYSGDTHAHFLTACGASREQRAEDLNVVNVLATQWGNLFTGFDEFTGGVLSAPDGPYVAYVSQENRQHVLGHLVLLGLKRPVLPACSDGPPEAEMGGAIEVTLSDWADRCHEQGGTVIIPHVPRPNGELAALVATGRADGFEMIVQHPDAHAEYYRYLNCGYAMPLVGGTDKMGAEVPVGLYRTYAQLGDEEFSYDAWCRAVRAGRTFLSGGPLIEFTVEGQGPGEVVKHRSAGRLTLRAEANSIIPIGTLQIVCNGVVVAEVNDPSGSRTLRISEDVTVEADSWFAARCGGPGYFNGTSHSDVWTRGVFAHTSPVYATVGAVWRMFDSKVASYLLTMLQGGMSYVQHMAPKHRQGTTYHHGESNHDEYLARPFREAIAALNGRLDEAD